MSMSQQVLDFLYEVEHVDTYTGLAGEAEKALYHGFVEEEYKEFIEATDDAHKLQEAMDLIWVTLGYCLTRGWDIDGAWLELTRSNMSKLQIDPVTKMLKRRADGKIQKPEGWKKPDFTPFVSVPIVEKSVEKSVV